MAIERTFSIVKPDAVAKNVIGEIYSRFEKNGLRIIASPEGARRASCWPWLPTRAPAVCGPSTPTPARSPRPSRSCLWACAR